jgi:hypothetical protein
MIGRINVHLADGNEGAVWSDNGVRKDAQRTAALSCYTPAPMRERVSLWM